MYKRPIFSLAILNITKPKTDTFLLIAKFAFKKWFYLHATID